MAWAPGAETSTVKILNNHILVSNMNSTNQYGAIGLMIETLGAGSEVLIAGNVIAVESSTKVYGIHAKAGGAKVIIKNNFIHAYSDGSRATGLYCSDGTGVKMIICANNSITTASSAAHPAIEIANNNAAGASFVFVNNILADATPSFGPAFEVDMSGIIIGYLNNLAFNYPNHVGGTEPISPDGSNTHMTGQSYTDLFQTNYDPDLTDGFDADLHLYDPSDTFAVDEGTDASGSTYGNVVKDIDGDLRPQGAAWDRGADER